ncbi:MAG: prolyl-tRNA synthetase associated domain-containing protein [Bacteroidales bacterium]|nr:prolyl-tRNA synthetase associated domain-containing protein [Bacteroidales bacterium]
MKHDELRGDPAVYETLSTLNITFDYHPHPPAHTVEEASKYWAGIDSTHCKNLFFRNHKGNKHFLVILEYTQQLNIHELEKKLNQGKLTFASPQRMMKYLGVTPGSVSPFGLLHDTEGHVHVFIDSRIKNAHHLSFHPNLNTASLIIAASDFFRYLNWKGNTYEFIEITPSEFPQMSNSR